MIPIIRIPSRLRSALVIVLIIVITLLFIQLFAKSSFNYDSFSFALQVQINPEGGTSLVIPPVGKLFFQTHQIPWQIIITLNEIDFTRLEKHLNSFPPRQEWLTLLQQELRHSMFSLFFLVVFFGVSGGMLVLLAFRVYPNTRRFWLGLSISFLTILCLIGGTVLTFDQQAIERPQYQGVLAAAPWAMNLISMGMDNVEVIGDNLKKISQTLPLLYKQAGQIGTLGNMETDLTMLHVSDIHNNPAAMEFISELITNFQVQLVIDTGDLTDYGTALETEIVAKIEAFKIPYIVVPGNHDSPLIIDYLQNLANVKVLGEKPLTVNGLTIVGMSDPAADVYNSDTPSDAEQQTLGEALAQKITEMEVLPEIVAVHNLKLAKKLIGTVPLILHGHDHQYRLSVQNDTIIVDAGTTGAAGFRGLLKKGVPYSASILYWKKDSQGKLRLSAIDSIKINGSEGKFSLERHTFATETENTAELDNSVPAAS